MLTAMKDLDDIRAQSPEQGFQFPGVFEINAMGSASAQLERKVVEVLEGLGLSVLAGSQRVKPSRAGNYVSVSVSFTCPSPSASTSRASCPATGESLSTVASTT